MQSKVLSLQRDIQTLQQKLAQASNKAATLASKVARVKQSIAKTTSLSTLQSKQREIQRLEGQQVAALAEQAQLNKRIAEKTKQLHAAQQQLRKHETRTQDELYKELQRREEESQRERNELAGLVAKLTPTRHPAVGTILSVPSYDAFISHATEDKEGIARPLAEALRERGWSIWYDEFQLQVGDSLRRSIDKGLANSRFGVVILSPHFFEKNWTQYELDGLFVREMSGGKIILPIWHKISKDELVNISPSLADKFALNTATDTLAELADKLSEAMR